MSKNLQVKIAKFVMAVFTVVIGLVILGTVAYAIATIPIVVGVMVGLLAVGFLIAWAATTIENSRYD